MNHNQDISQMPLIMDGAMGTYVRSQYGIDDIPERLNLTHPEVVSEIHRAYVKAGAKALRTNTYAWVDIFQDDSNLLKPMIESAYHLASEALSPIQSGVVFANLGPLPHTLMERRDHEVILSTIIEDFLALGARHFLIETCTSKEAAQLVAKMIHQQSDEARVWVNFAFTQEGCSQDGEALGSFFKALDQDPNIDAMGLNCVAGPTFMLSQLRSMGISKLPGHRLTDVFQTPFGLMPNAGFPKIYNRSVIFSNQAPYFAKGVQSLVEKGAAYVGGCCGTTPEFIQAVHESLFEGAYNVKCTCHLSETKKLSEINVGCPDVDGVCFSQSAEQGAQKSEQLITQKGAHDEGTTCSCVKSSLYERLQAGQFVLAVEYDAPDLPFFEPYLEGVLALESAGADAITIALLLDQEVTVRLQLLH